MVILTFNLNTDEGNMLLSYKQLFDTQDTSLDEMAYIHPEIHKMIYYLLFSSVWMETRDFIVGVIGKAGYAHLLKYIYLALQYFKYQLQLPNFDAI